MMTRVSCSPARRARRGVAAAGCLVLCLLQPVLSGCAFLRNLGPLNISDLSSADRLDRGLIVILPGIEGRSPWNVSLARGLDQGGLEMAIEINDWNTEVPGPIGLWINLRDAGHHEWASEQLRDRIVRYRTAFPERPVHLIGHSGGAGIALMTNEILPRQHPVTSTILLAAAVSPERDLRRALRHNEQAIFNFYSQDDVYLLKVGTTLFGTVEGAHGVSAGAVGFRIPALMTDDDKREYAKLRQIRWKEEMAAYGNDGGHMAWTDDQFVAHYLAPRIRDLVPEVQILPKRHAAR